MKELFQKFIEGFTEQQAWAWGIIGAVMLVAIFLLIRKEKFTTKTIATGASMVAIAFVLSVIQIYKLPNGGSITPASMLPIIAFAYVYGTPAGVLAGLVYGILQMFQGAYYLHPVQFMFDYVLPFALLGFAGFFKKKNLILAILVACVLRFLSHYIAGATFWREYAGEQNPWVYSLIYNGTYMLPETIICVVVALIPAMRRVINSLDDSTIKA